MTTPCRAMARVAGRGLPAPSWPPPVPTSRACSTHGGMVTLNLEPASLPLSPATTGVAGPTLLDGAGAVANGGSLCIPHRPASFRPRLPVGYVRALTCMPTHANAHDRSQAPDLLVATPGRLTQLLTSPEVSRQGAVMPDWGPGAVVRCPDAALPDTQHPALCLFLNPHACKARTMYQLRMAGRCNCQAHCVARPLVSGMYACSLRSHPGLTCRPDPTLPPTGPTPLLSCWPMSLSSQRVPTAFSMTCNYTIW